MTQSEGRWATGSRWRPTIAAVSAASAVSLICLVFFFGHSPVLGGDRLSETAATHLAKAHLGHGLPFSSYRRVELRGGGFAVERHWLGIADGHSVVDGDDGSFRVQKSPNSGTGTYARLGFGVVLPGALILLALAPRRRVREPSGD